MSQQKHDVFDVKLDAYEQEIEDALPEHWEDLPITANLEEELAIAKEAAANHLSKNAKINIRLTHFDVEGLKRIAVKEGLPYQTLIASILHKYVTQHLPKAWNRTIDRLSNVRTSVIVTPSSSLSISHYSSWPTVC